MSWITAAALILLVALTYQIRRTLKRIADELSLLRRGEEGDDEEE